MKLVPDMCSSLPMTPIRIDGWSWAQARKAGSSTRRRFAPDFGRNDKNFYGAGSAHHFF